MSADLLRRASATLRERANAATPPPWREGFNPAGYNAYAALVADVPHPDRPTPAAGGWDYDETYGGCLIGEAERDKAAVERAMALHIPKVIIDAPRCAECLVPWPCRTARALDCTEADR